GGKAVAGAWLPRGSESVLLSSLRHTPSPLALYPLSRLRERVGVRALLLFGFALSGTKSQSVPSAARPGSFLFAGPRRNEPKKKGLPRQSSLAKRVESRFFDSPSMARSKNGGHPCPPPSGSPVVIGVQGKGRSEEPYALAFALLPPAT